MNIALINKETNSCENIAVFEDIQKAVELFGEQYIIAEQTENYGIGDIYKDGIWSKKECIPAELPQQRREHAYETMRYKADQTPLILWKEEALTVNEANKKWMMYSAEGSEIANELSVLIVMAKSYIREIYPDNE
ncbi:hypothetical protein [Aminipila terrae]|uniref:Uncharacterized protein n=1 Tax=Aminipila terrae TaxID=2697030 RepID=A0A6P1MA16_9FIRM|nr:hypothetical protein [Aminipila terrae]QHI71470.1 hypothetical protein Ami3637_02920 [Aminipila terrae]